MATKVGINGFGRIGRNFFRAYLEKNPGFEVVAVNDLADPSVLAHLLKYDSTLGVLDSEVKAGEGEITVDGSSLAGALGARPERTAVEGHGGRRRRRVDGPLHGPRGCVAAPRQPGPTRCSSPHRRAIPTSRIVLGVNDDKYDAEQHHIISNASCTTNWVAPMAKILLDTFGLEAGFMTTIHAYTTEQQLQDQVHMTRTGKADLRRMRSAALEHHPRVDRSGQSDRRGDPRAEGQGRRDGHARPRAGRQRHRPRVRARRRGERARP